MNHQPFEDWLLEEKPLTPAEKRQLETHMQSCGNCTALAEVNLALHSTTVAAPAPGFVDRFQVRLGAQRKLQHRRAFWGFFILVLSVAGVLAWLAWPVLALAVESPSALIGDWMTHLVSLWISIQAVVGTSRVLFTVFPGFIPPYVWTLAVLILAGLGVLGVASLAKFTKFPQGV